jgi:hypothetical protein
MLSGGGELSVEEGAMELEAYRPTVWEVRRFLLSTLDLLQSYAHHRPEHASAVAHFSQELRKLKDELMSSFEEGSAQTTLPDILNQLTAVRGVASLMAERHPEKSGPLTQFVEGLEHPQAEFIGKVRPQRGDCP